ncbi:chorismate pyruvate-lyase [Microbulbifer sp. NBRC 101763]|uniref:chorismate--pyruvate lyase family protein n=1 Tax=unclassified Microbulbifer TaxID=2619833 RepID=UPI0024AD62F7|nr:chorismate lyase [Microbulbifer sp. MLAF003]WHI51315.1 chorismate lyase [Microbulbifer sp. MLAF003]
MPFFQTAELSLHQSPFVPTGDWRGQPLEPTLPEPPESLLPWLEYSGSLTAALKQQSGEDFRVQVLFQGWQTPLAEECRALKLREHSRALVREVLLYGCGQPWVYARSVLPMRSLQGKSRNLRSLDDRPLGELLFSEPGIRRGDIQFNRLQRNPNFQLETLCNENKNAWGRRSTFWLRDKPLLVAETFLSSFQPETSPLAAAVTN